MSLDFVCFFPWKQWGFGGDRKLHLARHWAPLLWSLSWPRHWSRTSSDPLADCSVCVAVTEDVYGGCVVQARGERKRCRPEMGVFCNDWPPFCCWTRVRALKGLGLWCSPLCLLNYFWSGRCQFVLCPTFSTNGSGQVWGWFLLWYHLDSEVGEFVPG